MIFYVFLAVLTCFCFTFSTYRVITKLVASLSPYKALLNGDIYSNFIFASGRVVFRGRPEKQTSEE